MTIWRTCVSLWVPKATNTHSEYVIVIGFPLQQWLHERASTLRYTCIGPLVTNVLSSLIDPTFLVRVVTVSKINFRSTLLKRCTVDRCYITDRQQTRHAIKNNINWSHNRPVSGRRRSLPDHLSSLL
jgi:hypothetical protein